jgi:hypothetical protein
LDSFRPSSAQVSEMLLKIPVETTQFGKDFLLKIFLSITRTMSGFNNRNEVLDACHHHVIMKNMMMRQKSLHKITAT